MGSATSPSAQTSLVFLTGDFCSGSTLLFTLFRHAQERYHTLYEPMHEQLLHWLAWPLRPYENHFNLGNYTTEYRGFDRIGHLFDPAWGASRLAAGPDDDDGDLYRYLSYLIGTAFGRSSHVALKENRFTFRMAWLRARFPAAKVVHVYRDRDQQWRSMLRRVQAHVGREDIGQDSPDFRGFNIAPWCDDLAPIYPELARENFGDGYSRFCALWQLSKSENQRHADVSLDFAELTDDFDNAWARIAEAVGLTTPASALRPLVVKSSAKPKPRAAASRARQFLDRGGRRYAEIRVASLARRRARLSN